MHKPEGCTYPNCFVCPLPDCEYEEEDLKRDQQAEKMRMQRKAKPEQYRNAQRLRRQRMEAKDPGHAARLAKEARDRKKQTVT